MILTDYFESKPNRQWELAKQVGVNHAVVRLPETPDFDETNYFHWKQVFDEFEKWEIKPVVLEPIPNCIHDHIKRGDDRRDECIERFLKMLPIMDRLDIRVICANFMADVGWYRTSNTVKERGGACVAGFDIDHVSINPNFCLTQEKLWDNLERFLRAAIPDAERYGVKIAVHPDDPPVPKLQNASRILINRASIERALKIVPSDNVGVALCQGCYGAMGENIYDVIEYFCKQKKVFFVHFRDVRGTAECFHETFHDNGPTDMAQAIRLYHDYGYEGPIRVDHVPTMAGEENHKPGYELIGRLFAIGYLKGLLDASGYDYI